jgi:hypothetical protein
LRLGAWRALGFNWRALGFNLFNLPSCRVERQQRIAAVGFTLVSSAPPASFPLPPGRLLVRESARDGNPPPDPEVEKVEPEEGLVTRHPIRKLRKLNPRKGSSGS